MGVAEKTDARILVGEAGRCVEFAHHIAPALGRVERGVHDGEVGNHAQVLQPLEPVALFVAQLVACPCDGTAGVRVAPAKVDVAGTILVVVTHDARHLHVANNLNALTRIRIVTNHVPQAHVVRAVVLLRILEHHLERFEVGVDVSYQSVLHSVQRKSPCDFKPSKIILTFTKYDFLVPDVAAQSRVPNRLQELLQLSLLAFGDQLYPAIRQIPDDAENVVPGN